MNKPLLFGGLGVTALLIAALASGFGKDTRVVRSPLVGRIAPPFSLQRLDGKGAISLDSLKGKPAVVNFWATWCEPCQMEHHILQAGSERFGSDVQFVGIVYEDEPQRIRDYLAESGGRYPTVIDREGKTAISYGVYGVPETFFINASGQIISKYEGPLSVALLAQFISQIENKS